jgi:membrane protease YdiL (CAAX protease family)
MGTSFLEAARLGKNDWWRYVLGVGLVFFMAFLIGAMPMLTAVLVTQVDGSAATDFNRVTGMLIGVDPLLTFALLMCSFVAMFLGLGLAVRFIHRRPAVTLVTPGRPINWGRIAQGFTVWVLLIALASLVEAVLFPGRYQLTFDPIRWLAFAVMGIFLVPIQATSEELFFRGYALQGLGTLTRNPLLLSLVTALMFALLHFANPEVSVDFWPVMGYYFVFGVGMALITLRDNSLELAIGAHAGNNLFGSLLANFEGSALQTPAIFTADGFDPLFNLVGAIVVMVLFYLLIFKPWRAQPALAIADPAAGQD